MSGITGAGRAGSLTLRWAAASHYLTSPRQRARALRAVLDEVATGRFSPRIAGRFPLTQASQAHALLASRAVQENSCSKHDCPPSRPDTGPEQPRGDAASRSM